MNTKPKYISVILIILSSVILINSCNPHIRQKTKENINHVLDKYCTAFTVNAKTKFKKKLNKIVTDDFLLIKIHPSGTTLTKTRVKMIELFTEMIKNKLEIKRKFKDRNIFLLENNKAKVKAIYNKGYSLENPLHADILLVKRNNKWLIKKITIKEIEYKLSKK